MRVALAESLARGSRSLRLLPATLFRKIKGYERSQQSLPDFDGSRWFFGFLAPVIALEAAFLDDSVQLASRFFLELAS